jgi:uncharacterized protein YkwD
LRLARTLLACSLLVGVLALPAAQPAEATTPGQKAMDYLNQVRKRHGLKPYRRSRDLSRSSRGFALWQMRHDRFGHRARVSCSRRWRSAGEALALYTGSRLRWRYVIRRWLRSSSHRSILLSSRFRYVGIGIDRGIFRGGRATIWVLQAGRR